MISHNVNTLWGQAIVEELLRAGIKHACITPGGRSAPLAFAMLTNPEFTTYVHLDERSAGFFALGRAKRTGVPTPIVCTSGTAVANLHPSVIEADLSRTPMLLFTADRPSDLLHSGSNQTISQDNIFSKSARWNRTLPEPELNERKFRSLRSAIARSLSECNGMSPGPVHLNVPFRKPLEPNNSPDESVIDFIENNPLAAEGRTGPYTKLTSGKPIISEEDLLRISNLLSKSENGLIIAGPSTPNSISPDSLSLLSNTLGFPILADPLSGLRFGKHVDSSPICGGYDSYLNPITTKNWPNPDVVIRFGAAPISLPLQNYLLRSGAYELLIDPTGKARDPVFSSSELVSCDPTWFSNSISCRLSLDPHDLFNHFLSAESDYWALIDSQNSFFEGSIASSLLDIASANSTIIVSNSMPIRDIDRFGKPSSKQLTLIGNRGASGIDGVISTALGAASSTTDQVTLLIGDVAYYHDLSGLLALNKFNLKLIIIEINNNGGGIFYRLPISKHDPPFTSGFRTPHDLDLSHYSNLYGFDFTRVSTIKDFNLEYESALDQNNSCVIEVISDPLENQSTRENLQNLVVQNI